MSENVHVSYFHFVIWRCIFFNYHRPSHGFSFGTHCCGPLTQQLVQLHLFSLFQCLVSVSVWESVRALKVTDTDLHVSGPTILKCRIYQ